MDMEFKSGKMGQDMKEILELEKSMGKVSSFWNI